jgi:hypothetical protein
MYTIVSGSGSFELMEVVGDLPNVPAVYVVTAVQLLQVKLAAKAITMREALAVHVPKIRLSCRGSLHACWPHEEGVITFAVLPAGMKVYM